MTIRVRGIYATALTELFHDDPGVVQASPAIDDRFEDREFPTEPARVRISTTDDRQGVGVIGDPAHVRDVAGTLGTVGIDTLCWRDRTPAGAIFDGVVEETLGSGAVVRLDKSEEFAARMESERGNEREGIPPVATDPEGFLPYRNADDRIETGDTVRVQVRAPRPPWSDDRAVLDTAIRVERSLLTLQRGGVSGTGGPHLGDVLPIDPPAAWGVRWAQASEDASLDGLGTALERASEKAAAVDDALAATPNPDQPERLTAGQATTWVWFGRSSRFELDDVRRGVTPTMPGHHRTKAGANAASAAVDLVESLCPDLGSGAAGDETADFPFGVVTSHFGPSVGDRIPLHHGKPDGRTITLGQATVQDLDADGSVTLEREMGSSGTYDGLETTRERGDRATTKIVEGRWWYPTMYRSAEGDYRGTYVNVCTPVEVFPDGVRYVDLHVDVVKRPDGSVERLDDDELDAAEAEGYVPPKLAKKARDVADAVEGAL